jgi:hypothetical protein
MSNSLQLLNMSPRRSLYLLKKNLVFTLEEYTLFILEKIVFLQYGNYNSMESFYENKVISLETRN